MSKDPKQESEDAREPASEDGAPTGLDRDYEYDEDDSLPGMDPPSLTRLDAAPPPARPPVVSEQPPEPDDPDAPRFLADNPFGDNRPGYGGDTPFFVESPTARFDFEMDETDGIPTGLPDLRNLDAFEPIDFTPAPEDELAEVSNPVMAPLVLGREPTEEVPAGPLAPDPAQQRADRLVGFAAGVVLASVLWGILVMLLLQR